MVKRLNLYASAKYQNISISNYKLIIIIYKVNYKRLNRRSVIKTSNIIINRRKMEIKKKGLGFGMKMGNGTSS